MKTIKELEAELKSPKTYLERRWDIELILEDRKEVLELIDSMIRAHEMCLARRSNKGSNLKIIRANERHKGSIKSLNELKERIEG